MYKWTRISLVFGFFVSLIGSVNAQNLYDQMLAQGEANYFTLKVKRNGSPDDFLFAVKTKNVKSQFYSAVDKDGLLPDPDMDQNKTWASHDNRVLVYCSADFFQIFERRPTLNPTTGQYSFNVYLYRGNVASLTASTSGNVITITEPLYFGGEDGDFVMDCGVVESSSIAPPELDPPFGCGLEEAPNLNKDYKELEIAFHVGKSLFVNEFGQSFSHAEAAILLMSLNASDLFERYFNLHIKVTHIRYINEAVNPYPNLTLETIKEKWASLSRCVHKDIGITIGDPLESPADDGEIHVGVKDVRCTYYPLGFKSAPWNHIRVKYKTGNSIFSSSSTLAHEICHELGGIGEEYEPGSPCKSTCDDIDHTIMCQSVSEGRDFFLHQAGQKAINGEMDCLRILNTIQSSYCTDCEVEVSSDAKDEYPIPLAEQCDPNDGRLNYSFRLCNGCIPTSMRAYIQIENPEAFSGINCNPGIFPVVKDVTGTTVNRKTFFTETISWGANECRDYTFSLDFNTFPNPYQAVVTTGFFYGPGFNTIGTEVSGVFTKFLSSVVAPGFTKVSSTNAQLSNLAGHVNFPAFLSASQSCSQSNPRPIKLNGKLNLNLPEYCFIDTKFMLEPGSELVVKAGARITFRNCTFYGCDQLWKGIRVEDGGVLIMEDCRVSDALYGVLAERGSKVYLQNNDFDANYIGVKVQNTFASNKAVTLSLKANDFTCSYPLKTNFAGSPVAKTGTKSYVAVRAENLLLAPINGLSDAAPSLVDNHVNGFWLDNCTVSIINRYRFSNIRPVVVKFPISKSEEGAAVRLFNTRAFVYGQGKNSVDASFHNCYIGVQAKQSNLTVQNTRMKEVSYGIYTDHNLGKSFSILDNSISASQTGMTFAQNILYPSQVTGNNIVIEGGDASSALGIDINGSPGYAQQLQFAGNNLTIAAGIGGVSILSTDRVNFLDGNSIAISSPTARFGMEIAGSYRTEVTCSNITFTGTLNEGAKRGIHVKDSPEGEWACNNLSGFSHNLAFDGMSVKARVKGNVMSGGNYGLVLGAVSGNSVGIDPQKHSGNVWNNGTFSSTLGAFIYSQDPITLQSNQFAVDNIENNSFYTPNNDLSAQWILKEVIPGSSYYCTESACTLEGGGVLGGGLSDNTKQILGTTNPKPITPFKWESERFMLERESASMMNSLYPGGYGGMLSRSTSIGTAHVAEVLSKMLAASNPAPADLSDWDAKLQALNFPAGFFLPEAGDTTPLDTLLQGLALRAQTFAAYDQPLQNQLAVKHAEVKAAKYTDSSVTRDTIDPLDNMLSVFELWRLLGSISTSLDSADSTRLHLIASVCPSTGGLAVYAARAILAEQYGFHWYEDDACAVMTPREGLQDSRFMDISFAIIPNPASAQIIVQNSENNTEPVLLEIHDLLGRLCLREGLKGDGRSWTIDISPLQAGMYWVCIQDSKKARICQQLIVQH